MSNGKIITALRHSCIKNNENEIQEYLLEIKSPSFY